MNVRPPVLYWIRQDLRLADNPALSWALNHGVVIPVYVLEDKEPLLRPWGDAGKVALHHALADLKKQYEKMGTTLILQKGKPFDVLLRLARQTGSKNVTWSRCYEPTTNKRDKELEKALTQQGLECVTHNASLLFEPHEIKTKAGTSFKVFTPFYRTCLANMKSAPTLSAPRQLKKSVSLPSDALEKGELCPAPFDWAKDFAATAFTEKDALNHLRSFIKKGLKHYKTARDIPSLDGTSGLSTALRLGCIGPRQIWNAVTFAAEENPELMEGAECFLRELVWREFSYHLFAAAPQMATEPLHKSFKHFPWRKDAFALRAWQKGQTGYPMVDAGMRQLWQTGIMHNRVRMIVASFLVKHLLLPWQEGEKWFWNTLTDADTANNAANWQWVAGCGADAAPFFRIFNPILQGKRFDPKGDYVRRFVPELANLSPTYIHAPWLAPPLILEKAGIELGKTYPKPIVEHAAARNRALEALKHKG